MVVGDVRHGKAENLNRASAGYGSRWAVPVLDLEPGTLHGRGGQGSCQRKCKQGSDDPELTQRGSLRLAGSADGQDR